MSLPSINFVHLTVSEIQPRQTFSAARLPAHSDTTGENIILTALKGCGVKNLNFNNIFLPYLVLLFKAIKLPETKFKHRLNDLDVCTGEVDYILHFRKLFMWLFNI